MTCFSGSQGSTSRHHVNLTGASELRSKDKRTLTIPNDPFAEFTTFNKKRHQKSIDYNLIIKIYKRLAIQLTSKDQELHYSWELAS